MATTKATPKQKKFYTNQRKSAEKLTSAGRYYDNDDGDRAPSERAAGTLARINKKLKPSAKPRPKANGSIGTYKGPKPRAYSSLSKADKAKEDAQNTRDAKNAPKKPRGGGK